MKFRVSWVLIGALVWVMAASAVVRAGTTDLEAGHRAFARGDYRRALQYYTASLHLAQRSNFRFGMEVVSVMIGDTHMALGNRREALKAYRKALRLADQLGRIADMQTIRKKIASIAVPIKPPELLVKTRMQFDSLGGSVLDGHGRATLFVTVRNRGAGRAKNIEVQTQPETRGVIVAGQGKIRKLDPGESQEVTLLVRGGPRLRTGNASLLVWAKESFRFDSPKVRVRFPTVAYDPPVFQVGELSFRDVEGGLAKGNGNGIWESGETIEVTLAVTQRRGSPAKSVSMSITGLTRGVEAGAMPRLGVFEPGQSQLVTFRVAAARTARGGSVELPLTVRDGHSGAASSSTLRLHLVEQRPRLHLALQTRTKQAIVIGRSAVVEATVENQGSGAAEDIELTLQVPDGAHAPPPVRVGRLLPGSRVKREFSLLLRGTHTGKTLPLTLLARQADFPETSVTFRQPVVQVGAEVYAGSPAARSRAPLPVLNRAREPRTFPKHEELASYYRRSWAVVIGISHYRSPEISPLSYAVTDARAMASALRKLGFPPLQIEVLVDAQATKAGIERALFGRFKEMGPEDRLLVFFSGHARTVKTAWNEEEGYLLPVGADPDNLPLTAIPMTAIEAIGKRLPAKHILVAIDACFSGYAVTRDVRVRAKHALDLRTAIRSRAIELITAGTKEQMAIERGGYGVFTQSMLDGMQGEADPHGSGLTAVKLANFVFNRVVRDTRGRQTPLYSKLEGQGDFLLSPPVRR